MRIFANHLLSTVIALSISGTLFGAILV